MNGELSLIGAKTTVEGIIRTDGSIRIDGKLVGDLIAQASAAVGATAAVEGNVTARNISIAGKVNGMVTAFEKLILEGKSALRGDIRAARLVVDEGAMFDGKCAMTPPPGDARAVQPQAPKSP
ncbi:MAG: polymer-forming cytoskeletal protein [Bacteroidota bacterium]